MILLEVKNGFMKYNGFEKEEHFDRFSFYNGDCMDLLKQTPDKYYELCIVDPPYGIGDKFKGGKTGKMNFNEVVEKDWDKVPPMEYWDELFRVSKNQIVWGGNYFPLPPSRCFIVWDKQISEDFSLAMAELAWTSFDKLAKIFKMPTPKDGKIHPTQKPIQLYEFCLKNYAQKGFKIIDTHLGSGSIALAIDKANKLDNMNLEFVGIELDTEYFNAAVNRFRLAHAQSCLSF